MKAVLIVFEMLIFQQKGFHDHRNGIIVIEIKFIKY